MARTNFLPTFRVFLTCWLGFQVLKATTLLHFAGKRHGYYDSKGKLLLFLMNFARNKSHTSENLDLKET